MLIQMPDALLPEKRNKNSIIEPEELFVTPTKQQLW
jgi:hypothetical protein